ncbi:MAG: sigma-54-dependent Fis family transcriptional regulator [Planctomycetes bacterium]|nr:sigma-54-dependent Fis family transcriptional regulator [Planctomycetota bacterium]
MPAMRARVLIVDDEPIKRSILADELPAAGYTVETASNPLAAEPLLAKAAFDVVLTDLRMPGRDGLSFLKELRERRPDQAVMVMTAYGTVETAVEAMKLGAFDYIQKPFSTEELLLKLDRILSFQGLQRENKALREALGHHGMEAQIIGRSEAIRQVLARIHAVAGTDSTVLITGESGTGKELAARVIHETSHRSAGPFVAVSCAALPRELVEAELFGHEAGAFTGATKRRVGRFELADGGTLLLDDVDDIPLAVQPKLLRAIQERRFERLGGEEAVRVNIRVIATTKRPLSALVASGEFREDLYYRLNVVPLELPPLRERGEDVVLLTEHFLRRAGVRLNRDAPRLTPGALAKLKVHPWPGNVRELEHYVERLVATTQRPELDAADLPELAAAGGAEGIVSLALNGRSRVALTDVVAEVEERLILWALERSGGSLTQAAEMLGVPRSTLQYKLSRLAPSRFPS